jgi:hypothetical protein
MATTVVEITARELQRIVEAAVERKLAELLGDPDEGLRLRKAVRDRLLRQRRAVAAGKRGEPLQDVVKRLGLE